LIFQYLLRYEPKIVIPFADFNYRICQITSKGLTVWKETLKGGEPSLF